MKLYIIPAYEETVSNQGYRPIIEAAKTLGYDVEILDLQIQNLNFKELVKNAAKAIVADNQPSRAILGFSTGALIAYAISTKVTFNKAYFCSISPLLNIDIPKSDAQYVKHFSANTVQSLKNSEYGISIAKEKYFFVGDKEGIKLPRRTKQLAMASAGELVIIKNNDHELNGVYVKAISSRL